MHDMYECMACINACKYAFILTCMNAWHVSMNAWHVSMNAMKVCMYVSKYERI